MGYTTFKKIDRQRYKKIYPSKRKTPRNAVISDKSIVLESVSVAFTEASGTTVTRYQFRNKFETVPTVTVGVTSTSGDMVIPRITTITTTEVFIEVTAAFDGSVDIQVLQILDD
tara:strand:- start:83 stop:424 length:342 start_codon:yes stop_codon:yes gene_type:complete